MVAHTSESRLHFLRALRIVELSAQVAVRDVGFDLAVAVSRRLAANRGRFLREVDRLRRHHLEIHLLVFLDVFVDHAKSFLRVAFSFLHELRRLLLRNLHRQRS